MINKIYDKIKQFIKNNWGYLLFYSILLFLAFFKLPYYIYTGGGVLDTSKKIEIESNYIQNGKFNFAYVESRNANIPMYLIALFNKDWDIEKQSSYKITDEETLSDIIFRDKLDLNAANQIAIYNAYLLAGKEIDIKSETAYVYAKLENSDTNLNVGDIILSVNNIDINDVEDVRKIVKELDIGTKIKIVVKQNEKEIEKYATIYEENGDKLIGVAVKSLIIFDTDPQVKFKFASTESGPSGGLMMALTIYNKLTEKDLTKGLNIVGTGTIDYDGNIGAIGGVKYKLAGAVKNKADIFMVSNEENYEEAMKIKNEKGYKIEIVGVSTFKEAVEYLESR